MIDVGVILQRADIGHVISKLGIVWEKRRNKRGYELYFPCPTNNHVNDVAKLRCSIADSGKYKGMFNCWACGFSGNLIHLIKHVRMCDFKSALVFLESEYGSSNVVGIEDLRFRIRMNKSFDKRIGELPVFDLPSDYKLLTMCHSPDAIRARDWLESERNIDSSGIRKFGIGFTNHNSIGPSIVVPIIFKSNINSIFYAQPFKGGLKRYPKGSPQGEILFNYDECIKSKSYIMMESILDVVKFDCVTRIPSMACFTNMISQNQIDLLRNFDCHGVMPDLDGERGWDLVQRMVKSTGKGLWLYFCPIGKDPGDCTVDEIRYAVDNRLMYCDYESEQIILNKHSDVDIDIRIRKK